MRRSRKIAQGSHGEKAGGASVLEWRQGWDYEQFEKLGSQGRKLSSHTAVVTEGSTR